MSIFRDAKKLLGEYPPGLAQATGEFWDSVKDIRDRLGTRSHLLDGYITLLMNAVCKIGISEAAEAGESAYHSLRGSCANAFENNTSMSGRPYYKEARQFYESRAIKGTEKVQYSLEDWAFSCIYGMIMQENKGRERN